MNGITWHVQRWNGSSWEPYATGFESEEDALAALDVVVAESKFRVVKEVEIASRAVRR